MIRVIIADDSSFIRAQLEDLLTRSGIAVLAAVENGAAAVVAVKRLKPDVVIMDYEMPVMDGVAALEEIRQTSRVPVIIFSAYTPEGAVQTLRAIKAGAHDVILKPMGDSVHTTASIEEEIIASVNSAAACAASSVGLENLPIRDAEVICVGSSAGGVYAAGRILPQLPENTPPIVWVQHMPSDIIAAFAARLDSVSKIKVKLAVHGEPLRQGVCYMSAVGTECGLKKSADGYAIALSPCKPGRKFCPSCDGIFESAAQVCPKTAMGVILSGIGSDGTDGLVKLHDAGGFVVGQSEASCVVYGMPRSAAAAGAVDIMLSLEDITALLCGLSKPEAQ